MPVLPALPSSCLPAVLRRRWVEARPWNWLPGCWEPPARRHRPAASAWSAEPPRWTAAGARTATPGVRASRGTSPDPLRMMSVVREASLDQTGGNTKKVKGSHRKHLTASKPLWAFSLSNAVFARTSICPYPPRFCMHIHNTGSSKTSLSVI